MNLTKNLTTINGEDIISLTMCTAPLAGSGERLSVELMSLGAGIRKIAMRRSNGSERLLTLSYQELNEYRVNGSLAGLTIGPNAGRVPAENGLTANEGKNQIHGGLHNIATHNWELSEVKEKTGACEVVFQTEQPDGLDGWPGNRSYLVTYRLEDSGILTISYLADTDRETYINLTNHTYWLSDGLSLEVAGDRVCQNDESFLPVSVVELSDEASADTPSAYNTGLKDTDGQPLKLYSQKNREGIPFCEIPSRSVLNNGFIISKESAAKVPHPAALLTYPDIDVELLTDAPALVVYTGDYLDSSAELYDGSLSSPRIAFALEAQEMATLQERTRTLPSQPFERTIQLCFKLNLPS